jgi:hypothetical protein
LRGEESWLSLAGLFWLKPGENPMGSGRHNGILLPEGAAPAVAGHIEFDGNRAVFHPAPGVEARSSEGLTALTCSLISASPARRFGR